MKTVEGKKQYDETLQMIGPKNGVVCDFRAEQAFNTCKIKFPVVVSRTVIDKSFKQILNAEKSPKVAVVPEGTECIAQESFMRSSASAVQISASVKKI